MMWHNPDLKEIERRVQHSAYQDGLLEVFLGGYLLLVGASLASQLHLAPLTALLGFLLNPIFERAKKRYIYPRIGYVQFRPEKEADPKGIVAAGVVFVLILLGSMGVFVPAMGKDRGWDLWFDYFLPASAGFMLAIGPFWLGQTYNLRRGYVLAVLFLLSGVAIPVLGIATGYRAVGFECLFAGSLSLVSGVIMFTHFLRKYPPEEVPGAID
jgi:hypothetical protein